MNIALFTDSYIPMHNGVAHSVSLLKKGLIKRGHRVCVVRPEIPRCTEVSNLTFKSSKMPFIPEMRFSYPTTTAVYKFLKDFAPDIIHTHTEFMIGRAGSYYAKKLNVSHIHTYHTLYEDYTHYIKMLIPLNISKAMARNFSASFCNKADIVIAPTEKIKMLLGSYGTFSPIFCIPTGLDLSKFSEKENLKFSQQIRSKYKIKPFEKILLYVGRVAKEKNIDELLQMFSIVSKHRNDCVLMIVGSGNDMERIKNMATSLECFEKIKFCGMQKYENIAYFYKASDVFVSASNSETQGLTYIEALASSKPVLAKQDECLNNVLVNNINGFAYNGPEEFCKYLDIILSDNYNQFSANAAESAKSFNYMQYALNVERVYKKAVYAK